MKITVFHFVAKPWTVRAYILMLAWLSDLLIFSFEILVTFQNQATVDVLQV